MKVEQVYQIVNNLTQEILGAEAMTVATDLTNVVDVGKAILDNTSVDNYVRKLIDHIGKVVFVNRPYTGRAPSVLMDGWEYGAVMEKIDVGIPEAEVNPAWNLQDGQVYEQDKFTAPKDVVVKFWKDKVTFQVPFSFAEEQVKGSFSNATQLNAFFSMIYTKIDTSFTIKLDALIMATINNFTAYTYLSGKAAMTVNLMGMYKKLHPDTTLTKAQAILDPEFIRFAALQLKLLSERMTNALTCFNQGGRVRHTPQSMQKIVMHSDFAEAANIYLQSDTFHNEFTKLPNADKVSFWQGPGVNNFDFEDTSSINIAVKDSEGTTRSVAFSGILAVVFDREALGVNNLNRRVTNHYNAPGEFINNWYKMDAQYFNDYNENFVLLYITDASAISDEEST